MPAEPLARVLAPPGDARLDAALAERLWATREVVTGRRGLDLIARTASLGLCLGTLGFVSNLLVAVTIVAGIGVGAGYLGVVLMAWLQERTKPALCGRVMSLMMFVAVDVDPLSYALMGVLGELDLRMMFAAAGSLLVTTALLGTASRTVRGFR